MDSKKIDYIKEQLGMTTKKEESKTLTNDEILLKVEKSDFYSKLTLENQSLKPSNLDFLRSKGHKLLSHSAVTLKDTIYNIYYFIIY